MSTKKTRKPEAERKGTPRVRASREQTTARILDAAEELFASRNPNEVTVREVAEKAGVSHALVHQYVGSKDDLLNAVIQRVITNRVTLVEQSPALREAIPMLVQQIVTNRVHTKTLVRSAMDGVEYVSLKERIETGSALLELTQRDLAAGAEPAPPPHDLDVRVVLSAITALAFGWGAIEDWLRPIFGLEPLDADEVHRQVGEIATYIADLVLLSQKKAGAGE